MKDNLSLLEKRSAQIRLTARTLADSTQSGSFASMYRGTGIEFSGVRDYVPGQDDVRSIDWNVSARMNRPFVKEYEEEKELQVFIILDTSFSMRTGRGDSFRTRLDCAVEAASLISLAASRESSPVGAVFFDSSMGFSIAPKAGKSQTMLLLTKLESAKEEKSLEKGTALGAALKGAAHLLKKHSLIIVLSDFRTAFSDWEKDFSMLALKHDLVAVRISDSSDSVLPEAGSVPLADPETNVHLTLPTFNSDFARAWKESQARRLEQWKQLCFRRGAHPLEISLSEDCALALSRFFGGRL